MGIRWYTAEGQTVQAHGVSVTPRSWVLEVLFGKVAYVWHRPFVLLVDDGRTMPIYDLTPVGLLSMAVVLFRGVRR